MGTALVAGAALLGLAGAPHCAAMCGAASAALWRGCGGARAGLAFHAGRLAGYAAVGAVLATGVASLGWLAGVSPALRPLWALLHVAALALGLWLLARGQQPAWLAQWGRRAAPQAAAGGWQRMHGPLRAGAAGSLWFAWPCGLLQSAWVMAALADGPLAGASVMAAFALASSVGLWAGPWLWSRWGGGRLSQRGLRTSVRAAGACLAVASGWSLARGLWPAVSAWCAG